MPHFDFLIKNGIGVTSYTLSRLQHIFGKMNRIVFSHTNYQFEHITTLIWPATDNVFAWNGNLNSLTPSDIM